MIIKLNRRHIDELADIDFESEHQNDAEHGITRQEMRKDLVKRFKQNNSTVTKTEY